MTERNENSQKKGLPLEKLVSPMDVKQQLLFRLFLDAKDKAKKNAADLSKEVNKDGNEQ